MDKITNIAQLLRKYNSYKISREELRRLLKSEPFGKVTGIIGPFVLRYKNNKLIISRRAVIYNASKSRESIKNRSKFAAETKFASALNHIPALKKIWAQADVEGVNSYHKLIKFNQMPGGYPSLKNSITPRNHNIQYDQMCSLDQDLSIKINENASLGTIEQLVVVIVPFDPLYDSDKPFEIIHLCLSSLQQGTKICLNDEQLQLLRRYKKFIMYSALLREAGRKNHWPNTAAFEGKISFFEENDGIFFVIGYLSLIQKAYWGFQQHFWMLNRARDG